MMGKHGIQFSEAYALDATALRGMPQVTIQPTLEYDAKRHTLQGPLLSTVLAERVEARMPSLWSAGSLPLSLTRKMVSAAGALGNG